MGFGLVGKLLSTPKLIPTVQLNRYIHFPTKWQLSFISFDKKDSQIEPVKTNTCEAQEKILKDLFEWQEGDFHPSLQVNKGDYGWGMYAKADVPSDTTMLSITREHGINIETAIETILR